MSGSQSVIGGAGTFHYDAIGTNDFMVGTHGNDYFYAGKGDDTMVGGAGDDVFYGGAGADTFIFVGNGTDGISTFGTDIINDFAVKQGDKLRFSGGIDPEDVTFQQLSYGAYVKVEGHGAIFLNNVVGASHAYCVFA